MKKVKKKARQVSPRKASPGGATRPSTKAPRTAASSTRQASNRDDWVQLSFRAPPPVEEFVTMMHVKRKITFQTLMLGLLRELGAPISDADLEDNRKGRKTSSSSNTARQALKSKPFAKCCDDIAARKQLRDPRFWEQIAQQGNRQAIGQLPGTLQVIFANFAGDRAQ